MALILWHNPRCSTSRKALAMLEARGLVPQIRLYLQDPPSLAELQALGLSAAQITRWKDAGDLDKDMPEDALFAHLARNPALIERPILITYKGAALGRPPEAILDIL